MRPRRPLARGFMTLSGAVVLAVGLLVALRVTPGSALASGNTYRVAPSGSDTAACGSESAPCRTIQQAVNLAQSGDTVLVAAGTYTYSGSDDICSGVIGGTSAVVCFLNKQLTILGGFTTEDWSVAAPASNVTIIDGESLHRVMRVQRTGASAPDAGLRLEGFTIQNGRALPGSNETHQSVFGGGLLIEDASMTVRDVVFRQNAAEGGSGGSNPNWKGDGAGGGLAYNNYSNIAGLIGILERVTFENNRAQGGSGSVRGGLGLGGGLFTYQAMVSGRSLQFQGNTAVAAYGGGSGRTGDGQSADGLGGAAAFEVSSAADLEDVVAYDNVAQGGSAPNGDGGGAFGGAFLVEGASLTIRQADVRNNLARGGSGANPADNGSSLAEGGALMSISYWGGGSELKANIALDRVALIGNTAMSGNGGTYQGASGGGAAALTFSNGIHQITNCIFGDNLAEVGAGANVVGGGGGGLWLQGVAASVTHSTFARNRLGTNLQNLGAQGLAIVLVSTAGTSWPSESSLSYLIVADHTSILSAPNHRYGLAAIQATYGTTVNLNRGLYAGNTLDDNSTRDAPGWRGTFNGLTTMLSASSAGFVSPGAPNENYHIRMSSPARDQATGSAISVDIDSDPRSVPDIGADEWVPFSLSAFPSDGAVDLAWWPNAGFGAIVHHYAVVVTCPQGAAPPRQGSCDSPITAGSQTTLRLTGLTNDATYGFQVDARDASGALLTESVQAGARPWQPTAWVYLPLTLRNR